MASELVTAGDAGASFAEAFVDVGGCRLRYLAAGAGAPLVVVQGGDGLQTSRAHALLAAQFRIVAFEAPGVSTSWANAATQSSAEQGATLVAAARAVGLERFSVWGASLGGAVAIGMALAAPESIEALVLEAPAAILPDGGIAPAALADGVVDELPHPGGAEVEARLSTLAAPTLVVFGTRDEVIPPEMGRIYRERMPNCNYVLVYDAGHHVAAERPEAFASLVSDFLTRREAFIVSQTSTLLHP